MNGKGGRLGSLRAIHRLPGFQAGDFSFWGAGTDALLAVQVGSASDSTFYAISDKLGSIRALVLRKDGSWRWGMRYRPYGAGLDSTGTAVDAPYRWTGREYDPETGFYFLRARYYDPAVGRFTQEDPLGTAGGTNLYAYVDGQPLEARDPSGMLKDYIAYSNEGAMASLQFLQGIRASWEWAFASYGRANAFMNSLVARGYMLSNTRPLSPTEIASLGSLCTKHDCTRIRIAKSPNDWGLTMPMFNTIWLPEGADTAMLAHEVYHFVVQYPAMGAGNYLAAGAFDHAQYELYQQGLADNPYDWQRSDHPNATIANFGFEQQASIVESCYRGNARACQLSPYGPGK